MMEILLNKIIIVVENMPDKTLERSRITQEITNGDDLTTLS